MSILKKVKIDGSVLLESLEEVIAEEMTDNGISDREFVKYIVSKTLDFILWYISCHMGEVKRGIPEDPLFVKALRLAAEKSTEEESKKTPFESSVFSAPTDDTI